MGRGRDRDRGRDMESGRGMEKERRHNSCLSLYRPSLKTPISQTSALCVRRG